MTITHFQPLMASKPHLHQHIQKQISNTPKKQPKRLKYKKINTPLQTLQSRTLKHGKLHGFSSQN
jgi:hypothetical protein